MSHFREVINASSLAPEVKDSLIKLYDTLGNSPALREAVSQSFQVQIEKIAEDAGLELDQDPQILKLVQAYEGDVGALVATLEATTKEQIARTKQLLNAFHPQIDSAVAAKIRSELV